MGMKSSSRCRADARRRRETRAIGIGVFAFGGTILFEAEFRGDGVEAEEFGQDADVVGFGFGHGIEAVEEAIAAASIDGLAA